MAMQHLQRNASRCVLGDGVNRRVVAREVIKRSVAHDKLLDRHVQSANFTADAGGNGRMEKRTEDRPAVSGGLEGQSASPQTPTDRIDLLEIVAAFWPKFSARTPAGPNDSAALATDLAHVLLCAASDPEAIEAKDTLLRSLAACLVDQENPFILHVTRNGPGNPHLKVSEDDYVRRLELAEEVSLMLFVLEKESRLKKKALSEVASYYGISQSTVRNYRERIKQFYIYLNSEPHGSPQNRADMAKLQTGMNAEKFKQLLDWLNTKGRASGGKRL